MNATLENTGTPTKIPSRRGLLMAGCSALITGCTAPPTLTNLVRVTDLLIRGAPDAPFTPEYIDKLPYASLTAKVGRGQRSLLILAEYDGPYLRWMSANEAALVTGNGRLIKTAGLDRNLVNTQGLETDPIAAQTFEFTLEHLRTADLGPGGPYGVPIRSRFKVLGRQTIDILNKTHDTFLVREKNQAMSIRWNFVNKFWLDSGTGYVWKSIQHFAPKSRPIEIEVTKPAAPRINLKRAG